MHKRKTWKELTSNFVPDEFAGLYLPDGRKQRPDLLLSHGLGQIVYDEISLWIFGWSSCLHWIVHIPILLLRRDRGGVHAIHLDHWKRNTRFTWHKITSSIQLKLNVTTKPPLVLLELNETLCLLKTYIRKFYKRKNSFKAIFL